LDSVIDAALTELPSLLPATTLALSMPTVAADSSGS